MFTEAERPNIIIDNSLFEIFPIAPIEALRFELSRISGYCRRKRRFTDGERAEFEYI